jgi:hypothetical protein
MPGLMERLQSIQALKKSLLSIATDDRSMLASSSSYQRQAVIQRY